MLTLTENACTIVKTLTTQPDAEQVTALRISTDGSAQPAAAPGFVISAATQPESDDQVVEQSGATVYLDPPAAEQLGDKVLDAGVDESGNVQFALAAQA